MSLVNEFDKNRNRTRDIDLKHKYYELETMIKENLFMVEFDNDENINDESQGVIIEELLFGESTTIDDLF